MKKNAKSQVSVLIFQAGDVGEEKKRFSWDGSLLHDINISASATKWEKVAKLNSQVQPMIMFKICCV